MTTSTTSSQTSTLSVAQIRQHFLDFFAQRGHTVVTSSPLIPANDPTLMFTNSGMVQFKDVFLGTDQRSYVRAASVQACLRAGGKHNDLENVGYTARHHTFFEMMGNWSFGDYFKKESLQWAWELLTTVYRLPPERLLATVYAEDEEAYAIWTQTIGLPPERVIRIGDNKGGRYKSDNFWMMADTGPCGPCSEIFYDHGESIPGGPPGSPDEDGDRFIEIWNNVFMQFEMHPDGSVTPLPAPCVDTGMGLERLAAILQGVHSNYEIDLFQALIHAAAKATGCSDWVHPSLRVIADHLRACSFLIADGVIPSNEGRGYVERRIIRRAIRHGYKLGCTKPFFHRLVPCLIEQMGEAYPHLAAAGETIMQVLQTEEIRFFETLANGMGLLETELARSHVLSGQIAFKLHDTYGFPLDLTADVCRERGIHVDVAGFDTAMNEQKALARAAGKFKMDKTLEYTGPINTFVGYETLKTTTKVLELYREGVPVSELASGDTGVIVLQTTPFYAEGGGQVGDIGVIHAEGEGQGQGHWVVTDTQKIKTDVFGHHGFWQGVGVLKRGDAVVPCVDQAHRHATMRHHSATHLLHWALRQVLGDHVQQKGSMVNAERTRFDFAHHAPLTEAQLHTLEDLVNQAIGDNHAVVAEIMPMDTARETGAMMLFGEKYGETVRVLSMGSSKELCGGTHVNRTGDLGFFKIVSQSAVGSGIRRIEAVAGSSAITYVHSLETALHQSGQLLKAPALETPQRLTQTLAHIKQLETDIDHLKAQLAQQQSQQLASQAVTVGHVQVLAAELVGADAKMLRTSVDQLKAQWSCSVVVLASVQGDKVQLAAGVSVALQKQIHAGQLVHAVAQHVGGKGGGKADFAMAGGTQVDHVAQALASVVPWVQSQIG